MFNQIFICDKCEDMQKTKIKYVTIRLNVGDKNQTDIELCLKCFRELKEFLQKKEIYY